MRRATYRPHPAQLRKRPKRKGPTPARIVRTLSRAGHVRATARRPGYRLRDHGDHLALHAEGPDFEAVMGQLLALHGTLRAAGWWCRLALGPVVVVEPAQLTLPFAVKPFERRVLFFHRPGQTGQGSGASVPACDA